MGRRLLGHEIARRARSRREGALARNELRLESADRSPAAGPTSFAVKKEDPTLRALIDAALAKKEQKP